MKSRWLLIFTLFIFGNTYAFQPSIEIIEQFDDVKLVAFLNNTDIENYPLWNPLTETPPLTVREAIQAVQNQYKKNNEKLIPEAVKEIEIRELAHHKSYWHYLIKIDTDGAKKPKYQIYVVLMNGKVIPALTETESYK